MPSVIMLGVVAPLWGDTFRREPINWKYFKYLPVRNTFY